MFVCLFLTPRSSCWRQGIDRLHSSLRDFFSVSRISAFFVSVVCLLVPFLCEKRKRKQLLNVPCSPGGLSSLPVLPGSELDPLGLGAKPQQGRVEAQQVRKVLASLQTSRSLGWSLTHLGFIDGVCLRYRGLVDRRN